MFICDIYPRENDASREDPFPDVEINLGLNLSGPFIKCEEVDGCKGIDTVNCDRNDEGANEICICERWKAARVFEIIQTLYRNQLVLWLVPQPPAERTIKSHFCSGLRSSSLTLPEHPII
jgi:hypothetical protein